MEKSNLDKYIRIPVEINLEKVIYLQSVIRGFITRINYKNKNKVMSSQTFFEEKEQNCLTFNIDVSNNNDIKSQSTITAKKEYVITNNLEKNGTLMNFNPGVSRSIEFKMEEQTDSKYLNLYLVSHYI